MADSTIQNPHDGFFKETFGQVEFTREFLAKFLPRDVAACLELSGLQAVKDSFVDDELRKSQSDLVFSVPLSKTGEAIVYLLFEHKSYADRWTVFQMLKYVVRINERRRREGQPLCCVIPLVVYHGPTEWNVARELRDLIDIPAPLRRFVPQFSIELFDLSGYNDEQLRSQAFIHASLLLLKYIFRPELPGELTRIFGLMAEMSEQDRSLECVRLLLGYLVQGTDRLDQETLRVALKQSLPNRGEELMPTLAEQWASQGRDQGLAEGIERGTLIGAIETCRSILGEPAGSEGLARQPLEELRQLAQRLQSQVRERLAGK
jgi:predicted transposase/invertase (TIGR01784 family)